MKFFLFPTKSAIPESNGEIKATNKKAAAVTKLIKAVLFKVVPNISMYKLPFILNNAP